MRDSAELPEHYDVLPVCRCVVSQPVVGFLVEIYRLSSDKINVAKLRKNVSYCAFKTKAPTRDVLNHYVNFKFPLQRVTKRHDLHMKLLKIKENVETSD